MSAPACVAALQHVCANLPGSQFSLLVPPGAAGPGRTSTSSLTAQLRLPWCGRYLTWLVTFQTIPPYMGPDVVFSDFVEPAGSFQPLLSATHGARLARLLQAWSGRAARALPALLLRIVRLLLTAFVDHQLANIRALRGQDRLHFELSTLLSLAPPPPPPPQPALLLDISDGDDNEDGADSDDGDNSSSGGRNGVGAMRALPSIGGAAAQQPNHSNADNNGWDGGTLGAATTHRPQYQQQQYQQQQAHSSSQYYAPGNGGLEALLLPSASLACFSIPLLALDLYRVGAVTAMFSGSAGGAGGGGGSGGVLDDAPLLLTPAAGATAATPPGPGGAVLIADDPARQEAIRLRQCLRLHVAFSLDAPTSRIAPQISLQVPWQLLGSGGAPLPPLPAWNGGACLVDVVPVVIARLQPALDAWVTQVTLRQALLSGLAVLLGTAPLELNPAEGAAVWAVAWEGTALLLTVQCCPVPGADASAGLPRGTALVPPVSFPDQKPLLMVTVLRAMLAQPGVPAHTAVYRDYPWSPRWPPVEMAARIMAFLRTEIATLLAPRVTTPVAGSPLAASTPTAPLSLYNNS